MEPNKKIFLLPKNFDLQNYTYIKLNEKITKNIVWHLLLKKDTKKIYRIYPFKKKTSSVFLDNKIIKHANISKIEEFDIFYIFFLFWVKGYSKENPDFSNFNKYTLWKSEFLILIRNKDLQNFFDEKIFSDLEKNYLYIIKIPSQGDKLGLRFKKFEEDLKKKKNNLVNLFKNNAKFVDKKNKSNEIEVKTFEFLSLYYHEKYFEFFRKDFNLPKIEVIERKIKLDVYSKKIEEIKMKSNKKFVVKKSVGQIYKNGSKKAKVKNNNTLMNFFRKK